MQFRKYDLVLICIIICFIISLKHSERFYKVRTIVSDRGSYLTTKSKWAVNLLYLRCDGIISVSPTKSSAGDCSFWRCRVTGSIQCTVMPQKLLFWAVHRSAVVETCSKSAKVFFSSVSISIYALSKKFVKVLRSGSTTPGLFPVTEILLMILPNVGASSVDSGCISSTIKAATNLLSSVELIVLPGGELALACHLCFWLA